MMWPRYREVKSDQIPEISTVSGVTIRIICGELDGTKGPVQDIVIDPEYLDLTVPRTIGVHPPHQAGPQSLPPMLLQARPISARRRTLSPMRSRRTTYFDIQGMLSCATSTFVLFEDGAARAVP